MKVPKVNLAFLKKLWPKKVNAVAVTNHDAAAAAAAGDQLTSHKKGKGSAAASSSSSPLSSVPRPPPPEECPICHDPVGVANPEGVVESWTQLHCGHKFGTACIQAWLEESIARDQNTNPSCPICRTTAKHPCGHLVSPPPFPPIHLQWRPHHYPPPQQPRRRVRRRLTRRPGHPLRPPPAPRRAVQKVGDCRTCAENAEFDARMRRIAEQRLRQNTGESAATAGSTSRSAAIKAIIPGLKRSTNTVRTTIVNMGFDEERQVRGGGGGGGGHNSVFCAVSPMGRTVPRSPTPTPAHSRRLSI
ncbi:hypothetical protein F5B20DRAFT_285115 [Whalleya microplaca]|nr:hypothetical protein F5B20DRAFT_285115 [Whalleya microplaca]